MLTPEEFISFEWLSFVQKDHYLIFVKIILDLFLFFSFPSENQLKE